MSATLGVLAAIGVLVGCRSVLAARRQKKRRMEQVQHLVADFARTHPHLDRVRFDVADAIQAAVAKGRRMTPEQALEHGYTVALARMSGGGKASRTAA